jgi:hypothetical protein
MRAGRSRKIKSIVSKSILSIWIGIILSIDLLLSWLSLLLSISITLLEGGYYRKDTPYAMPIHEVILTQISFSIGGLFIGLIWSSIILIVSERLLLLLKFPKSQDRRFHSLTLTLIGFTMGMIVVAIAIGNGWMIDDQMRGRDRFERKLKWIDGEGVDRN